MEKINVLKFEGETLGEKDIEKILLKTHNPFYKKAFGLGKEVGLERVAFTYKPYWFIKILALEARPPFKPKKAVYVAFVDAVSGFAGLTYEFPAFKSLVLENGATEEISVDEEKMLKIVHKVQEKQIFRKYFLKRPEVSIEKYELVYLPYAKAEVNERDQKGSKDKTLYINLISGEIDS